MQVFYMESENIKKYFRFLYAMPPINKKSVWQLWSIDNQIDEYFKYATTYVSFDLYSYGIVGFNSTHVSNVHLPQNLIFSNEIKNLEEDRMLIFHFPDDYPEEKLFYFVLKYGAKKYKF